MLDTRMTDVTQILQAAGRGGKSALNDLLPLVYDELRKIAAARMARESRTAMGVKGFACGS